MAARLAPPRCPSAQGLSCVCPMSASQEQLLATGRWSLRCTAHKTHACLPSLSAVQFQEQLLATGRRSLRGLDASVLCGSALQVGAWASRWHAGLQCSMPGASAVHEAWRMGSSPSGSSNSERLELRDGWTLPCDPQERSDFLTMNCAGGGIDMVGVSSVKGGCVDISFAGEMMNMRRYGTRRRAQMISALAATLLPACLGSFSIQGVDTTAHCRSRLHALPRTFRFNSRDPLSPTTPSLCRRQHLH